MKWKNNNILPSIQNCVMRMWHITLSGSSSYLHGLLTLNLPGLISGSLNLAIMAIVVHI